VAREQRPGLRRIREGKLTSWGEILARKLRNKTGPSFKAEALMNHISENLGALTVRVGDRPAQGSPETVSFFRPVLEGAMGRWAGA